ncbi:hypothetical protein ACHQM5_008125 [Ranunculus cassubicifolius]
MSLLHFICVSAIFLLLKPVSSQQSYDHTDCVATPILPGSNYLCGTLNSSCETFIVYRVQQNMSTILNISSLFNLDFTDLLTWNNNLTKSVSDELPIGREVIIPIKCSCSGIFSQAVFNYSSSVSDSFLQIACGVFGGLSKSQTLKDYNRQREGNNNKSSSIEITVPVRCACPDKFERGNGVKYLVTYPVVESDSTAYIAAKFDIPEEMILEENNLPAVPTIYPQTTLLIPIKGSPVINLSITPPDNPSRGPIIAIPLKKFVPSTNAKRKKSYIVFGLAISISVLLLVVVLGFFIHIRRVLYPHSFKPLSPRSSSLSNFSADFIDGMSKLKHSLRNYSLEELQLATGEFSDASILGGSVYHGRIEDSHLAIEHMDSEDAANRVLEILTKINHLNIVRLEGFCYGSRPYLVFELASNGCLRDLLSNGKLSGEVTWVRRLQIAFDVAVGIHYLHHCTNPSYVHRNINSRNVLITTDWRAKITGFKYAKPIRNEDSVESKSASTSMIAGHKGYLAPEYICQGSSSPKVDIFAFGVVLLEIMSSKEAVTDTCMLKDSVEFLADGGIEGSSDCLEKLKEFMDPLFEGNYPLGDALCLTLLAKACVEKDPNHRPTMNDVLKALSRIV